MKKKYLIFIICLLVVVAGGWYAYIEYNRKNKDLTTVKTDLILDAFALIKAYEKDSATANKQYVDKIITVKGSVTNIDSDDNPVVIFLGHADLMSSVKCSMDSIYENHYKTIKTGSMVIIKGICTGGIVSDLGLGTDVTLNRCVVTQN